MVTPLYVFAFGSSGSDSLLVMASLSVATLIWFPLHNTVFDWVDLRMTGRSASDRPKNLRVIHALSHEITVCLITTPLLIWLGGHERKGSLNPCMKAYAGNGYRLLYSLLLVIKHGIK